MGSFSGLSKSLRQQAKNIESNASLLVRRCATVVIEELAVRTPIDSGTAISNWIVTLNSKTISVIESHNYGILGSTFSSVSKTTIVRALNVLKGYKPNDVVYIQNNTDYIDDLNKGTSKQAPRGFVQTAKARADVIISGTDLLKYNGVSKK